MQVVIDDKESDPSMLDASPTATSAIVPPFPTADGEAGASRTKGGASDGEAEASRTEGGASNGEAEASRRDEPSEELHPGAEARPPEGTPSDPLDEGRMQSTVDSLPYGTPDGTKSKSSVDSVDVADADACVTPCISHASEADQQEKTDVKAKFRFLSSFVQKHEPGTEVSYNVAIGDMMSNNAFEINVSDDDGWHDQLDLIDMDVSHLCTVLTCKLGTNLLSSSLHRPDGKAVRAGPFSGQSHVGLRFVGPVEVPYGAD